MDKGNVDEVNYFDFCEDVDNAVLLFGAGRDFNHSFNYYPKTQPRVTGSDVSRATPQDVEDVLARMRQTCKEQRIRISEFFRDFDKLRSGFITNAQFRIGLNMSKIILSGSEFKMLCEQFKAPKEGDHVKWREFADSVDEVFTRKGLETDTQATVGGARTTTFYGKKDPSESDVQIVEAFKSKFRNLVQRERLNAKSFF